jgi:16S rRNA (cytosine1402-N4)-methyltransferase
MRWSESDGVSSVADFTVGGAGHLLALLQSSSPAPKKIFAVDQDLEALETARERLKNFSQTEFIHSNFRHLKEIIKTPLQRITVDLGVSSHQLDRAERGFSFQKEGPLDMRMNAKAGESAIDWLMHCGEEDLSKIIWELGEEKRSRWFAKKWIDARRACPKDERARLGTITGFLEVFGFRLDSKDRQGRHPITRVFQAIRMHINDELGALDELLLSLPELLAPKGRVAFFTFHSLEDRCVKWGLRGILKPINKKVIIATDEERDRNPRSRSAKLRVYEKE